MSKGLSAQQTRFLVEFLGVTMPTGADASGAEDQATDAQGLREMIDGYLSTLPGDIRALAADDAGLAQKLAKDLKAARAAYQADDLTKAFRQLDACADALTAARSASATAKAQEVIPEGIVAKNVQALELMQSQWKTSRLRSLKGLGELTKTLSAEADNDLNDIGRRISALGKDLPDGLSRALTTAAKAAKAGDTDSVTRAKNDIASEIAAAQQFLNTNQTILKRCEENPFKIEVQIAGPVNDTLKALLTSLANI
ncbi:hypothetical protein [Sedimentitalea sp.]|uniref:hypothetical protein n=1 Tax=Sedimentitalea sp. TaxID=2048915 RepID=UPI0032977B14